MPDRRTINQSSSDARGRAELTLLGGAALSMDGHPLRGPAAHRHPIALLALLAGAATYTVSRDKLLVYLWPESDDRTARNRLTTCVHNIRTALGEHVIATLGGDLRLDPSSLHCDAIAFAQAAAAGDAERVVALYGGPYLDGFHLPGSPDFDGWAAAERRRHEQAWREALEALALDAERRGGAAEAVRRWEQLFTADPANARAALRLMQAQMNAGNPAAALRTASVHGDHLREEFGTEAPSEVIALAARIRDMAALPTADRRRLAALPFEIVGAEPLPGFTDGVHGDLLNRLSSISDVAVISRTSVMRFRGTALGPAAVARELGADLVLQGEVRAGTGEVRVDARLVDTRQDRQIWGEAYRSPLTAEGLFDVQAAIARRIADALQARLSPMEHRAVATRPTRDLHSHVLYVQGRGHLDERTEGGLRQATAYFQAALERDPENAQAWSGLADALALLGFYGFSPPEGTPAAMDAARRALAVDPSCGEAHASLGILHSLRQDGPGACLALRRAIELRPSHAEAYVWLGWVLLLLGEPSQSLEPMRRAAEIDPLAPAYRVYLAETWLANGEPERALLEARRAGEIQPAYGLAHFMRALVLHHLGRPEEAIAALEHARMLVPAGGTPTHLDICAVLGVVRAAAGDSPGARECLAQLEAAPASLAEPVNSGLVRAALGDRDGAFAAFGAAREWKSFSVEYLRYFFPAVLGPLRADPRWPDLLNRVDAAWRHGDEA